MEIELKLGLIEPDDLRVLLALLPEPDRETVQHNHYFSDAEGLLAEQSMMVRVREEKAAAGCGEPDRVVLTVKTRASKRDGIFRASEVEALISAETWSAVRTGAKDLTTLEVEPAAWLLEKGVKGPLEYQGSLMNRRYTVSYEGVLIEVDQTSFDDGHQDVEIEVEGTDLEPIRESLMSLCEENGIGLFNQTHGKYARFLRRCSF